MRHQPRLVAARAAARRDTVRRTAPRRVRLMRHATVTRAIFFQHIGAVPIRYATIYHWKRTTPRHRSMPGRCEFCLRPQDFVGAATIPDPTAPRWRRLHHFDMRFFDAWRARLRYALCGAPACRDAPPFTPAAESRRSRRSPYATFSAAVAALLRPFCPFFTAKPSRAPSPRCR